MNLARVLTCQSLRAHHPRPHQDIFAIVATHSQEQISTGKLKSERSPRVHFF